MELKYGTTRLHVVVTGKPRQLIGWPFCIRSQIVTSGSNRKISHTELVNRLIRLSCFVPSSDVILHKRRKSNGYQTKAIGVTLRIMTLHVHRTINQFVSKLVQLIVRNAGGRGSHVLYTKHSLQKQILIRLAIMDDWNSFFLSESPDRIRWTMPLMARLFPAAGFTTVVRRMESGSAGSVMDTHDGFTSHSLSQCFNPMLQCAL